MAVTVRLPGSLQQWTEGKRLIEVHSDSVGEAIRALAEEYPGVGERVLDETGQTRRFVNIYVNGEDVRLLQGAETPLQDGDELILAPAVAGG